MLIFWEGKYKHSNLADFPVAPAVFWSGYRPHAAYVTLHNRAPGLLSLCICIPMLHPLQPHLYTEFKGVKRVFKTLSFVRTVGTKIYIRLKTTLLKKYGLFRSFEVSFSREQLCRSKLCGIAVLGNLNVSK